MIEKLKGLKGKVLMGSAVTAGLVVSAAPALAEGESAVVTGIQTAISSVSADAAVVIGGAIGLSVIFWGAKVLWSKFRSMAK